MDEKYYGVVSEELLASALERPKMAVRYEEADPIRQAAHLLWGIIRNHPFRQGNKRTGVALAFAFLFRNGIKVVAEQEDVVELGLGVAEKRLEVAQVEIWLRKHTQPFSDKSNVVGT